MVASALPASALSVLGINFSGQVFKVDHLTGVGTLVGSTGLSGTNSLCTYANTTYTVDQNNDLYTVSRTTGVAAFNHHLVLGGPVRGYAMDTNDAEYAVVDNIAGDQLWRVSGPTGIGTLIGNMGSTTIQGLAVAGNGLMYAYDIVRGLCIVDRNTGATTDLDPGTPGQAGIQDVCALGTNMVGGRDNLFALSLVNGAETLIGSGGFNDIRGWAARQTPLQVDSLSVKLGQLTSGNRDSILHRDGASAIVSKFFVPNNTFDPVNVEVTFGTATAPTTPTSDFVVWTGRMLTSGAYTLSLDILNRSTNTFETKNTSTIGLPESTVQISMPGDLTNYEDNNHRLIVRYRVKPTGPTGSASWAVACDMFRWEQSANF